VALVLGLWCLSSPAAQATCSTSSNRVDNPKTKKVNENSDDIFVLRHGLITALGTDTVYGGGDGEDNGFLGYARDEGYVEVDFGFGSGSGSIHGAFGDSVSWSLYGEEAGNNSACVNDVRIP
jgi:hypothetical protein